MFRYRNMNMYLKMKMNSINKEKKVATLSTVLSMTRSCRLSAGINRTSFKIRSRRNVRRTDTPLGPDDTPSAPPAFVNCRITS